MAKKSRRARKRARKNVASSVSQPMDRRVPATEAPPVEQVIPDFHEYHYVITDLKRVAILAFAMFALLIALSFFIR